MALTSILMRKVTRAGVMLVFRTQTFLTRINPLVTPSLGLKTKHTSSLLVIVSTVVMAFTTPNHTADAMTIGPYDLARHGRFTHDFAWRKPHQKGLCNL